MGGIVYFSIMIGCAVFYLLTLVFGGEHDFSHHGDVGHTTSDHHDGDSDIREYLNVRSLLLFGAGFGAAGAIGTSLGTVGSIIVLICAVLSGMTFSYLGVLLYRALRKQEGNTPNSLLALEGTSGEVTTIIPSGGIGEIRISNMLGEVQYLRARSENGEAIPPGARVDVVNASSGEIVVRSIRQLPPVE